MTDNALKCKYNGGLLPIGYVIDDENIRDVTLIGFSIRFPQPAAKVDKTYNPTSVTATPRIASSTLSWELYTIDQNRNIGTTAYLSGNGSSISKITLQNLSAGTYRAIFNEHSPENLDAASAVTFIVRHPQPTAIVDRYEDLTSITGTQTIDKAEVLSTSWTRALTQ